VHKTLGTVLSKIKILKIYINMEKYIPTLSKKLDIFILKKPFKYININNV